MYMKKFMSERAGTVYVLSGNDWSDGKWVASANKWDCIFKDTARANARLIAAAPDLLEACEDVLAYEIPDVARRKIVAAMQKVYGPRSTNEGGE